MLNPASTYLAFRFDPPDDEGTETVTFIVGGAHRGGTAEGHLRWTGGMTPVFAEAIADRVKRWVDDVSTGQIPISFMDRVDVGDPLFE